MQTPSLVIQAAQRGLERFLGLDPGTAAALGELEGTIIHVHLDGLEWDFVAYPGQGSVHLEGALPEGIEPDCVIAGTPGALGQLAMASGASEALAESGVRITGDALVAAKVQRIAGAIYIDWEGELAKLTGDAVAHQISNQVRQLGAFTQRTSEAVERNMGEYLTEESRMVPARGEVEGFLRDVDLLRSRLDRLEARTRRLEDRLKGGPSEA